MIQDIRNQVDENGYIFLEGYRPNESIVDIANFLGKPITPWKNGLVQALVPRTDASPASYSGMYGHGSFPFHSDLAHWNMPPRYLLLRCVTGYKDIPTLLVDGHDLMNAITLDILGRAIFKPRRPRNGSLSLLRLCDTIEATVRLRWDEVFLKPASKIGEVADLGIREWLSTCKPTALPLVQTNDLLLIDNWRMLHARSPILPGCEKREIQRVYLEFLH